ncbi:MAG: hypothetical protein DHS20C20_23440 [Ardenticatenaceae bacterium]|nr:MAG: hypothetical protein DHS20C20_23440 [Ardenticatenaceae bacterium]
MDERGDVQKREIPTHGTLAPMIVEDVLTRWPQTAVIFQQHNMACIGCAVASFYTISEAADVYDLSHAAFMDALINEITKS